MPVCFVFLGDSSWWRLPPCCEEAPTRSHGQAPQRGPEVKRTQGCSARPSRRALCQAVSSGHCLTAAPGGTPGWTCPEVSFPRVSPTEILRGKNVIVILSCEGLA